MVDHRGVLNPCVEKNKPSIYGDDFFRMPWSMSIISRHSLVGSKNIKKISLPATSQYKHQNFF